MRISRVGDASIRALLIAAMISSAAGACSEPPPDESKVETSRRAVSTHDYIFRFESIDIVNTRSRVTDTDYGSLMLRIDGRYQPAVARYIGDFNNGHYDVGLEYGPVTI